MGFYTDDPMSWRLHRSVWLGIILAIIAVAVGARYAKPYLDSKAVEMQGRKQAIELKIQQNSQRAREDCAKDPGCDPGRLPAQSETVKTGR